MTEFKEEKKDVTVSENTMRPLSFSEYIGQNHIKEEIEIAIKASKITGKPLQHMLFSGAPGLGKTTIASIIANEMGSNLIITSAPVIDKPADLAHLLMNIEEGDILFIDEIHGLNLKVEESLYSAIEDFKFDINVETGGQNKLIRLDLKRFTLIGATTKPGSLSQPMRTRLPMNHNLRFYTNEELSLIIKRTAKILNIEIDDDASLEVAKRSRCTARIANNILERISSYAIVYDQKITKELASNILNKLNIDKIGASEIDRDYIKHLYYDLSNKPSGVKTISSYINQDEKTIEAVIEPFLIQNGLLSKTKRGRELTEKGVEYALNELSDK